MRTIVNGICLDYVLSIDESLQNRQNCDVHICVFNFVASTCWWI